MNRTLDWNSGLLDEIELVYEKAKANEKIQTLLESLENQALMEARANCHIIKTRDGSCLSPEQFDAFSEENKEAVIVTLARLGLSRLETDHPNATIIVRLSSAIPIAQACTLFDILNRLEKLDGALNVLKPKWTLELQVPLGGKKGLFQQEMLMMQLYPWISVREVSTQEVCR